MPGCDSLQGRDALFESLFQRDRGERAGNLFGQLGDLASELADVGVGAGDVGAGGIAAVDGRRQCPVVSSGPLGVTEGFGGVVVAGQEGVRVVVDVELGLFEEGFGLPGGEELALESVAGVGVLPGSWVGRRAGDTPPVLQVVGDGVEVVGHGSGGFDVEDPPQALAGSAGVALADDGCSQVPVLQRQGDAAAGQTADVPGDGPSKRMTTTSPSGSCGMRSASRPRLSV